MTRVAAGRDLGGGDRGIRTLAETPGGAFTTGLTRRRCVRKGESVQIQIYGENRNPGLGEHSSHIVGNEGAS